MMRALWIAALLALAGCAARPPAPVDAGQFSAVPGKAVIFIVRDGLGPGLSDSLVLDEGAIITTHPATYFRWEVAPGTHHIRGFAGSSASITVPAQAGQVYFVEHVVRGSRRAGVLSTTLQRVDPAFGRELAQRGELL